MFGFVVAIVLGLMGVLSGCYLGHVASGQAQVLLARRPIGEALADPNLPPADRTRLAEVMRVREFAEALGMNVGGRYRHYVAWPGDRIVTTVVATRPGELDPAGFWFPIVGRVPYKGYFDRERASRAADALRSDGLDVCEIQVRAYSTLGWFDDPVTGPMLRQEPGDLVETVLHELVHVTAFAAGQPEFNEGVASFIGEEARIRYYAETEGPHAGARERKKISLRRDIRDELFTFRDALAVLYASEPSDDRLIKTRASLEAAARERIASLPLPESAARFARELRLNDACLAIRATYGDRHACFDRAFESAERDLTRFVKRVREAAASEHPERALFGKCDPKRVHRGAPSVARVH